MSAFKITVFILICLLGSFLTASAQNGSSARQLYQIKIYHLGTKEQEQRMDQYLKNAYLSALHREGIKKIGTFKPPGQDTTSDRRIYVLTSFESFSQLKNLSQTLADDFQYHPMGSDYINAAHDNPPFMYKESILLNAFSSATQIQVSNFNNLKSDRIYELRNYESPTKTLNRSKVKMFNKGEIEKFDRLGFNNTFCENIITESNMPNLL